MKQYLLPSSIFKKKWVWFADPTDLEDVDSVTFFSYRDLSVPGFTKKEGITSVIDLSKGLEEIWEKTRKDFVRLQIEKGGRRGIEVRQDDNFEEFKRILEDFRRDKNLGQENYEVLRRNGILFSAYFEGKMIAGGIFIGDERHLRVWMLASKRLSTGADNLKQVIGQANRMVLWKAICYAKEHDMKVFDFCGLDMPEKEGDPMPALTVYKEAFGGERVKNYYYTKTYSPVLKFIRFIKKLLNK